jgi:hypothetical protein
MTDKRFTEIVSIGIVTDNVTGKEYNCEMRIDDELLELLNELHEENQELKRLVKVTVKDYTDLKQSFDLIDKENEQLKQDNNALIHLLENQSMIIEELHSKLLEYQVKEPIILTKEDLELMGKAISYYTHGRCGE